MRRHIHKRVVKHAQKLHNHINHANHSLTHIWELALVLIFWFSCLIFASWTKLPNNTSFSYPLRQVSTLECRTLYRNDMPDSCKINLPIIHGANYSAYQDNELYRSIYTVLRAAPYSDSWNQKVWAHAWVDIASARGTPLYSIWDGEVYSAWWNSAYWNLVRIKYIYNWEIVYGVYAHMDTISVKVGDKVFKWQRIWTVGNSWNTFWELWWYHVHFEIVKDNFGRPAYAYTNCPDLSKWHYRIIQNWLCRNELITYQYDPIKILESNSTYVAPVPDNSWNNNDWDNTVVAPIVDNTPDNTQIDKWKETIKDEDKSHSSPTPPVLPVVTPTPSPVDENIKNEKDNLNKIPVIPEPISVEPIDLSKEDPLLIDLDFTWLKKLAEHFSRLRDVEMRSELKEKNLMLWETQTIDIEVFKKWTHANKDWNYYNWVLSVPFVFLSNNDVVTTNINSLQLITKWKAKIEITWNKVGKSTLVIKLDDKKIWSLDIIVR